MTSSRPYLIRAFHQWISDNGLTPQVVVDASMEGVVVPPQAVKDGKVVLNISMQATESLELGNEEVVFRARFSGVPTLVVVPVDAVLMIFARENGQGTMFGPEQPVADAEMSDEAPKGPTAVEDSPEDPPPEPSGPRGRPKLKIVN